MKMYSKNRHRELKELLLFLTLKEFGPIGRYKLIDVLNLGEGTVRGLLAKFKKNNCISSSKRGSILTETGERELTKKLSILQIASIKAYDGRELKVGPVCVAVHMKGFRRKVRLGIEQRDDAIRGGGIGAITLSFEHGSLVMPGLSNLSKDRPDIARKLLSMFDLENDDIILIVFADDYWRALENALFAASSLKQNG